MKDQSNKANKPITNVEFGTDFGDMNSTKIADTIIMNKEKERDKQKNNPKKKNS